VEALGGTLECIYWSTDSHDGLSIADYPDTVAASGGSSFARCADSAPPLLAVLAGVWRADKLDRA
ncbi:MAG TPA: hypothetical protein VGH53_16390, partial [Streptosporangiaceae bacterium]|jgi:hypothetical protein